MITILAHFLIGFMSGQLARTIVGLDKEITGKKVSLGIIVAILLSIVGTCAFNFLTKA